MSVESSTNVWDKFAKEDPELYILTRKKSNYRSHKGQNAFYSSGVKFTEKSVSRVKKYLTGYQRCLEIGCGIGRLTFPHSKLFGEIYAVDISKTMLEKLNFTAGANSISNIRTFIPDEKWDEPTHFDYVYSFYVFQHIEDFSIIVDYIQRISTSLKNRGIALLQFDTHPITLPYKLRNHIPDFLLSKTHRKGIRRVRRSSVVLRNLFSDNKLEILEEFKGETKHHFFALRKT